MTSNLQWANNASYRNAGVAFYYSYGNASSICATSWHTPYGSEMDRLMDLYTYNDIQQPPANFILGAGYYANGVFSNHIGWWWASSVGSKSWNGLCNGYGLWVYGNSLSPPNSCSSAAYAAPVRCIASQ